MTRKDKDRLFAAVIVGAVAGVLCNWNVPLCVAFIVGVAYAVANEISNAIHGDKH